MGGQTVPGTARAAGLAGLSLSGCRLCLSALGFSLAGAALCSSFLAWFLSEDTSKAHCNEDRGVSGTLGRGRTHAGRAAGDGVHARPWTPLSVPATPLGRRALQSDPTGQGRVEGPGGTGHWAGQRLGIWNPCAHGAGRAGTDEQTKAPGVWGTCPRPRYPDAEDLQLAPRRARSRAGSFRTRTWRPRAPGGRAHLAAARACRRPPARADSGRRQDSGVYARSPARTFRTRCKGSLIIIYNRRRGRLGAPRAASGRP